MSGVRVGLRGRHGRHVVARVRISLAGRRRRHLVSRVRVYGRGLRRHLVACMRIRGGRRLRGRHDVTGVRILR
ncbi:MAG: hypothetical protein K2Y04_14420, partial [Caulobacteraceae bacterium]|nr:hypothetical protein [Caulobacteraceae bacterium]